MNRSLLLNIAVAFLCLAIGFTIGVYSTAHVRLSYYEKPCIELPSNRVLLDSEG